MLLIHKVQKRMDNWIIAIIHIIAIINYWVIASLVLENQVEVHTYT